MTGRHLIAWRSGGLVVLAGVLSGCSSAIPVAETPPPPVSVSQPLVREVVDHDDYEGRIAAVATVEVRARVRGHLVKVNFQDGQMVKEGDLLFEIDPRTYRTELDQAKAKVALSEAQLKANEAEYKRNVTLRKSGAVSQEELEKSLAVRDSSEAAVTAAKSDVARAQLDVDFTKVFWDKSGIPEHLREGLAKPIRGKTSRTQVTEGNLINTGGGETLLTTIVSVDPMYVYFDVDERSLLRYRREFRKDKADNGGVQPVKDLKIPVNVGLEGEQGYPHKGVIDFADNRVNPGTGTIQVRGVLPNPNGTLDAGMRARVRVPVSDPHKALMVTERAIGTDQGGRFVYVVNDQDVVERRDVQLDRLSDGLQVVREGVKPEDWVIVNGIQRVRDGAKVEPKRISMPGAPAEQANQEPKN